MNVRGGENILLYPNCSQSRRIHRGSLQCHCSVCNPQYKCRRYIQTDLGHSESVIWWVGCCLRENARCDENCWQEKDLLNYAEWCWALFCCIISSEDKYTKSQYSVAEIIGMCGFQILHSNRVLSCIATYGEVCKQSCTLGLVKMVFILNDWKDASNTSTLADSYSAHNVHV